MKVKVNPEECSACGVCSDSCPEVFSLGDDCALVKVDPVPPEDEDGAREAAADCPTGAIEIEEED